MDNIGHQRTLTSQNTLTSQASVTSYNSFNSNSSNQASPIKKGGSRRGTGEFKKGTKKKRSREETLISLESNVVPSIDVPIVTDLLVEDLLLTGEFPKQSTSPNSTINSMTVAAVTTNISQNNSQMKSKKKSSLTKQQSTVTRSPPVICVKDSSGNVLDRDDVSLYGTPKDEDYDPQLTFNNNQGTYNMDSSKLGGPSFMRHQIEALFQPSDNKLAMKLFGSKKALMNERLRQKESGHWIIHPCSTFRFVCSHKLKCPRILG